MKDEAEILWRLYADNIAHGRHHETMRSSVTNIVLIIAGATLTVIGFSKNVHREHLPLTIFLASVGLFGALFVTKHYERYCFHMRRARRYRDKLETIVPDTQITLLRREANEAHKKEFRRLSELRLSKFWVALHLLVTAFGILLTIMAVTASQQ